MLPPYTLRLAGGLEVALSGSLGVDSFSQINARGSGSSHDWGKKQG